MNKYINKDLAIEKKLIIDNNYSHYNELENKYKFLFEYWLNKKINLKEYNDRIKQSNLDFGVPNPTKDQLISGLNEYLNLEYIYILNNFFIEKLDEKDINLLNSYSLQNINQEYLDLINRTYKEIIKNNYINGKCIDEAYYIDYGNEDTIPSNMTLNDALVLKIFYSKNTKKLNDKEFLKNLRDKEIFLDKLVIEMEYKIKKLLNINIKIMKEKI